MIDPDQLLEHAHRQLAITGGAPRKVDLRRAVSSAYYSVFHELCQQAANAFAGNSRAWAVFYRSLSHGDVRKRCEDLGRDPLPDKLIRLFGRKAFDAELQKFAGALVELQISRHSCDYDPDFKIVKSDAEQALDAAAQALQAIRDAGAGQRLEFLSYILLGWRG